MIELSDIVFDFIAFLAVVSFVGGLFAWVHERWWGQCRRKRIKYIIGVYVLLLPIFLGFILLLISL